MQGSRVSVRKDASAWNVEDRHPVATEEGVPSVVRGRRCLINRSNGHERNTVKGSHTLAGVRSNTE